MIDPTHLVHYVIRPVLKHLELWSAQAEKLLLGTACQESQCGRWLRQIGGGPAVGIFQMEPATHDDLWANYLRFRDDALPHRIWGFVPAGHGVADEMIHNLHYAAAMCRVHYLRVPSPIPTDLPGQAAYYKKYYNTELGAGTVEEYIHAWQQFVPVGVV